MGRNRRKEITYHLTEEELDEKLGEADDGDIVRRLGFVKNLYRGDTIKEAANREGRSESTGNRWADDWNDGGIEALAPSYGGGRPPKLDEEEQDELVELLREGQPWKSHEIQHLLKKEFDVEFHPTYLSEFLRNLGLSYSIPRTKRPSRPENAEEILDERLDEALNETENDEVHNKRDDDADGGWQLDDDIVTDGGTVVGFFDASHPQPTDNTRRVWSVDNPHIERPLVDVDEPALGCYALNGVSVISFPEDQTKERICDAFREIREQNPGKRILLVLDNFSSHVCEYTRKRATQLGIDLVFLPVGSPHLNPIEPVWKSLKWEISPIVVQSAAEFRSIIKNTFEKLTNRVSFAGKWITKFLNLQKLS